MEKFSGCGTITLKTDNPDKVLELVLRYDVGNGSSRKRGYYFSIDPITIKHYDNGLVMKAYTLFSGKSFYVHGCTRKSKKAEAIACQYVNEDLAEGLYDMHFKAICKKEGFNLQDDGFVMVSAAG